MRQRLNHAIAALVFVLATVLPQADPGLAHSRSVEVEFTDLNDMNPSLALTSVMTKPALLP